MCRLVFYNVWIPCYALELDYSNKFSVFYCCRQCGSCGIVDLIWEYLSCVVKSCFNFQEDLLCLLGTLIIGLHPHTSTLHFLWDMGQWELHALTLNYSNIFFTKLRFRCSKYFYRMMRTQEVWPKKVDILCFSFFIFQYMNFIGFYCALIGLLAAL